MYIPKPEDTAAITLPEEILALCEQMAKNTHEVWAASRIADGWRYGPRRDDARREHPCLVPYEELSEEEKAYDRATSQETLRFILKMGYRITKEG